MKRDEKSPAAVGLSDRARDVLWAVIHDYVECVEPVSSRVALDRSGLRVSPATVRGVMGELEELGLLAKPHKSAGRIPTEAAFRLYVDALLARPLPALSELDWLEPAGPLPAFARSVTDWLGRATGQLGFLVTGPPAVDPLDQIRFVRVSSERAMAVLLFASGAAQTRVFEEAETPQPELDRLAARLSNWVHGSSLEQVRARVTEELSCVPPNSLEAGRSEWLRALELVRAGVSADAAVAREPFDVYVGDGSFLFCQPEFDDVARLRDVVATVQEQRRLLAMLGRMLDGPGLQVVIGSELHDPHVRACAVVTAPLEGDTAIRGVGVIGPVRMRYDRVIPAVRSLSRRAAGYIA